MCVHGTPHATKWQFYLLIRVGNIHCLKPCGRSQTGSWYVFVSHSLIFTDLEQQGAGNQGKKRFRSLLRQFAGTPPALLLERMFSSGSTTEPERFGKVRPLGLRGRTPYKAQSTLCVSLLNSKTKKKPQKINF